mgnify:CR=1 FL=1
MLYCIVGMGGTRTESWRREELLLEDGLALLPTSPASFLSLRTHLQLQC